MHIPRTQLLASLGVALLPAAVTAHPVVESSIVKRALSTSDTTILQLALYLEHLEFSLYSGGCDNFNDAQYTAQGFPAGFRENVCVIADQEDTHANTIAAVLNANGIEPVPTCSYTFTYTDPKTFVSLANMITSVGVGAYLGGSQNLTDNAPLLVEAGSILTTEARHDAYLRAGIGASPFPNSFDTALSAVWAYNLAQMFIVSCPMPLPLTLLPKLNLTAPTPPLNLQPPTPAGTVLSFAWDPATFFVPVAPATPLYIALINQDVQTPTFLPVTSTGSGAGTVAVPDGFAGVAFAVLTTFSGGLTENELSAFGTLAGPAEVVLS
ncbi:MAG: hypothetical protein M1819_007384 [Sarea resinae]|nr:MAG: hypothetical protein M1819_007384 [Sarea resinae]